jgi:hypothetical protein
MQLKKKKKKPRRRRRMKMRRLIVILGLVCIASGAFSQTRDKCPRPTTADTVREVIVVYTKIPGFMHTINGYCVRLNGQCIEHLKDSFKPVKPPLYVWDCETDRANRRVVRGE